MEFSEFLGYFSEILQGDVPGSLGVEGDEGLVDFVSGFVAGRSGCHHVEELVEFDLTAAVRVELSDHSVHGFSLCFNTQRVDRGFELSGVDGSSSVVVEEIKSSLDLQDFLHGDVLVGEPARVEPSQSAACGNLVSL